MDLPTASRRLVLGGGLALLAVSPARATPEAMQALARKYLVPDRSWRAQIMPQGAASAAAVAESEAHAAVAATATEGR